MSDMSEGGYPEPDPTTMPAPPMAPQPQSGGQGGGPRLGMGRRLALLIGVVAMVGGAVFAVVSLGDNEEGTPELAVRNLLDAAAEEDLLGVLEALPPSERDVWAKSIKEIVAELGRLEVLDPDVDLSALAGLEIDVQDAVYSTERLADGVALVDITGGTISIGVDPAEVPFGDLALDLAGDDIKNADPETETSELTSEDGFAIAAVREEGRWYASFWYSIAEGARRDAEAPLPPAFGVEPTGGESSPEEAVRAMFDAAVELDLEKMIGLLPPDEARVLHDYAPLFLPDAMEELDRMRDSFDLRFTTLDLATEANGREAQVTVEKLGFRLETTAEVLYGEFDSDDSSPVSYIYEDGCITAEGDGESMRWCGIEKFRAIPFAGFFFPLYGEDLPGLNIEHPDAGFVTVQRGGRWYVSPGRTLSDSFVAYLRVLDRDKLEQLAPSFGFLYGEDEYLYEDGFEDEYDSDYPDDFVIPEEGIDIVPPSVPFPDEDLPFPYDQDSGQGQVPPTIPAVPAEPAG